MPESKLISGLDSLMKENNIEELDEKSSMYLEEYIKLFGENT